MKITEKLLQKRGYDRYTNLFCFPLSDFQYQKCVEDEKGKKYFVNLIHYPAEKSLPEAWMAEMTNNEPHYTFQMHRVSSVDDVEKKMEAFWKALGCEYYEKFGQ